MNPLIANRKRRLVLGVFNFILEVLLFPWWAFKKKVDLEVLTPKKILLIRLDHIGDNVMTTPAFSFLRDRFPHAEISLLTNGASATLFREDPRIDKTFVYNWPWKQIKSSRGFTWEKIKELVSIIADLRREKFDIAVDFRGDIRFLLLFAVVTRSKIKITNERCGNKSIPDFVADFHRDKHEVERTFDVIRCFGKAEKIPAQVLHLSETTITETKNMVSSITGVLFPSNAIIVAPYSSKEIKSWPERYFKQLIATVAQTNPVFIVGAKSERASADVLAANSNNVYNLAGQTTLPQLAALTKLVIATIGVDTGVLHIAACFNNPLIVIFGPTRSLEYRPYSPNCTVIESGDCSCDQFVHATCSVQKGNYAACMERVLPEKVMQVIREKTQINK